MRVRNYRKRRPEPRDVLLLIEVADSSLAGDQGEKAELYATAEIKDYWIINLLELCIEVYREPRRGKYAECNAYHFGQSVSPLTYPKVTLDVNYVFAQ